MDTNALFSLGFLRKENDYSYDRTMILCGKMVKISIQHEERTDDWGISFDDGEIYEIGEVDEILDLIADYVAKQGNI